MQERIMDQATAHESTVGGFGSAFVGGCIALFELPEIRFYISHALHDRIAQRTPSHRLQPPRSAHALPRQAPPTDQPREGRQRRPPGVAALLVGWAHISIIDLTTEILTPIRTMQKIPWCIREQYLRILTEVLVAVEMSYTTNNSDGPSFKYQSLVCTSLG